MTGPSTYKVWFVTGSSRGLGRALVETALEAGDRVAATARSPERLQDLVDQYGDALLVLRLDVTDYDAAVRAVAQAQETFGRIDVVVNNAGYSDLASFEDTSIDSFRTQVDTNLYGVVNVSKAVVPVLREQGSGHIFQVSSLSVRVSSPGLTAYQAAKWAVTGFSSGLAHELAPFGVKVTVLEPGGMRTEWAGSSMTVPQPSTPYQSTIGGFAELVRAGSGHEASDPRRVAQVVRDLAGRDDAPVRLLLGADAVPMAKQTAADLAASDAAWQEVSLSVSAEHVFVGREPVELAKHLIDSNRYMVLGTLDPDGRPRVSPVYFSPDGHSVVYWVSSVESHHSRNIAERPEVSMVVFDSAAEIGRGEAVYLIAQAEVVPDDELAGCLDTVVWTRFPGLRQFAPSELRDPEVWRLYRARISEHSIHIPGRHPKYGTGTDRRMTVDLD